MQTKAEPSFRAPAMVWRIFSSVFLSCYIKTFFWQWWRKLFILLCAGGPTSILCDDPIPLLTNIYSLYIYLLSTSTFIHFYPLSQKLAGYFAPICWDVRQIYWISVKSKPYEEKGFQPWAGHRNSPEKVSSYSGSCVYPALDCFIGTLLSSILYSFQFCKKQSFRLLPLFNQTLRGGYSSLFANGGKEYFFILGETEDKYQKCFGAEFSLKTFLG